MNHKFLNLIVSDGMDYESIYNVCKMHKMTLFELEKLLEMKEKEICYYFHHFSVDDEKSGDVMHALDDLELVYNSKPSYGAYIITTQKYDTHEELKKLLFDNFNYAYEYSDIEFLFNLGKSYKCTKKLIDYYDNENYPDIEFVDDINDL